MSGKIATGMEKMIRKDYQQARIDFREAFNGGEDKALSAMRSAECSAKLRDSNGLAQDCEWLMSQPNGMQLVHFYRGMLFAEKGDPRRARQEFAISAGFGYQPAVAALAGVK